MLFRSVGNDRVRSADWLAALSMSRDGHDLNATVGVSDGTSIRFSRLRVPGNAMDNSNSDPSAHAALDAKKSGDSYVARLPAETPESWVRASVRRPIRVAIVHAAPRSEDARYLAAAVRAVGDVADREISVAVREESDSQVLPEADWVFRLGVARLPAALSHALADDNVNVVSDAPGDAVEQNRPTWIVASDDAAGFGGTRLWKRAVAGNDAGVMVWSDGYGEPLLTFTREGRAERWRFFSRFHPEWNDLVRRGLFPEWIRSLLLRDGDASMLRARDRRTADPTQLQPASRPAGIDGAFLPPPAERRTDLHSWIWTLAAALLAAERALSLRARPSRPVEAISAKSAESKSAEALR